MPWARSEVRLAWALETDLTRPCARLEAHPLPCSLNSPHPLPRPHPYAHWLPLYVAPKGTWGTRFCLEEAGEMPQDVLE